MVCRFGFWSCSGTRIFWQRSHRVLPCFSRFTAHSEILKYSKIFWAILFQGMAIYIYMAMIGYVFRSRSSKQKASNQSNQRPTLKSFKRTSKVPLEYLVVSCSSAIWLSAHWKHVKTVHFMEPSCFQVCTSCLPHTIFMWFVNVLYIIQVQSNLANGINCILRCDVLGAVVREPSHHWNPLQSRDIKWKRHVKI